MRTHTNTSCPPTLLLFSLFMLSFLGINAQCNQALNNFTYIGELDNSAYYLSNAPAQPMQAESIALGLGGHLVSINSAEENALVQAGINEMTFIGLDDRQAEGNVGWTDGSSVGFSNYDSCVFCQDNDADNDYVIMHPWNGGWSFMNRWSERNYVIEIECDDNQGNGGNNGNTGNGSGSDCANSYPGFQFLGDHGDSKYFISIGASRPVAAQATANSLNGHLATINNQAENDFVQSQIGEMVYIGLSDANAEGNLSWLSGDNAGFRNIDDNCGFCFDNDQENDYTMMHPWNGKWSFMNQWSARRYIMEVPCEDDGGNNGDGNNSSLAFSNCPADRTIELTSSASTAFVNWTPPTLTSSCIAGGISVGLISGPNNNSNLGEGSYTIQYRGSNNCGDIEMCSFTISVVSPQTTSSLSYANCPTDMNLTAAAGTNGAVANWTAPSLVNNCNAGLASNQQIAGPQNNSILSEGTYTIRYRGANNCGDVTMCSFTISVMAFEETTSVSLNCPPDVDLMIPAGSTTTTMIFDEPTINNLCGNPGTTLQQIAGPTRNTQVTAGNYLIRYRAFNNCNDITLCAFSVNVTASEEESSLEIECPEDYTVLLPTGIATIGLGFGSTTFNNDCSIPDGLLQQISGPARDSLVGVGTYLIEFQGSNFCGDTATCSFTVTVLEDNSSTSISVDCPEDRTLLIPAGSTTTTFFSQSFPRIDNVCAIPGTTTEQVAGAPQGSQVGPGNYLVEYKYSNACNDEAFCSYNIEVIQAPPNTSISVICIPDLTFTAAPGRDSAFVSWEYPIGTTDCPLGVNSGQFAGNVRNNEMKAIGNYSVSYRVTNQCGDVKICNFFVEVISGGEDGNEGGNVDYTANDQVTPYTGVFRPGTNVGYNPPWTDEEMADLAAGNPALGVKGIGAKTMRPGLYDVITAVYGYDFRLSTYEHYASLGMEDLTMIVGFPVEWHRDQTDYCGNGFNSSMFRNLYTDIWDDGTDGTPYNDENFYAAYLYEVVSRYGEHVKFWEIWNEPGFDLTGNRGWRQPGDPAGNWWDNDPDPCEYILRAPIEHYVRTLRISWEIIKTLQPDDYVAVAGVGFVSFLDAILRNTDDPFNGGVVNADYPNRGGAYFDVMGFHSYPDIDGTVYEFNQVGERIFNRHSDEAAQGITKTKNNYQDILDNYGYDGVTSPEKEWIITEINVPRKAFRPMAMSGGEEMQVNYIIKAVTAAMKNDIRQMHVYNLGDETTESEAVTEFDLYGLHKRLTGTEAYSQVRNQEAIAYKSAADFVFGSRYDVARTNAMNLPENLDGIALRLPNGTYKYIIWAKTTIDQSEFASGTYSFPASFGYGQVFRRTWNFTDTDQVSGISSSNISLTGRPIFITETANPSAIQARVNGEQNYFLAVNEIMPNPAVDEIKLVLQARESDNYDIQIYDATGRLVDQRNTFLQKGTSNERFDISSYSHGMYFIILQDSHMRSTKVKFIKVENLD